MSLAADRAATIEKYMESIQEETKKIKTTDYPEIEDSIKARINYIFMPVDELDTLINAFKIKIGV